MALPPTATVTFSLDAESRDVLKALSKAVDNMNRWLASPTIGNGEEAVPDNVRQLLPDGTAVTATAGGTLDDALTTVTVDEIENARMTVELAEAVRDRDEAQLALERRTAELDQAEADMEEARAMEQQARTREAELLRVRTADAQQLARLRDLEAEFDARGRTIDQQRDSIMMLQAQLQRATAEAEKLVEDRDGMESERDDLEQVVAQQREVITKQGVLIRELEERVGVVNGDNAKLERERDEALTTLKKLEKVKPAGGGAREAGADIVRLQTELQKMSQQRDTLRTQNERQARTIMQQRDMIRNLSEVTQ
jgi:hypothetical protein